MRLPGAGVIEGRKEGAGVNGGAIVANKESGFYFPPKDEALTYDDDGKIIQDGRWNWEWDGENRLKAMETNPFAAAVGVPLQRLEFMYDSQSRRIRKVLKEWDAIQETFVLKRDIRFLYDGWNMTAELDHTFATGDGLHNCRPVREFFWGPDLSGTMDEAGGVGGLVSMKWQGSYYLPCIDGNGNIKGWLKLLGNNQYELTARYDYDPFGNRITDTGPGLEVSPFGFSTKYRDEETGLLDYGYRFYDPVRGRWLNRDPMYEITGQHPEFMEEGPNLYGFVHNDPVNGYDFLGLKWRKVGKTKDKRRLIWERDDPNTDTLEKLAKEVDLDPQEASRWAKKDEENSCRYTTPNVWIMVKLLNGINSFRDTYTNLGDDIGDAFTFNAGRKEVEVTSIGSVVSTINSYAGDIIGLSLYAHGSPAYIWDTAGNSISQNSVLGAVDGNGFKLTRAYLMQCYSGAGGYDTAWKARCYKGRATVYYGVNACGIDFGKKPK